MLKVRDIPKEAKLISDSQDLDALSRAIGTDLEPDYGCAFVLYSEYEGDILAVWAVGSNIPKLDYLVDCINLA